MPFSNQDKENLCLQFYNRLTVFFLLFLDALILLESIENHKELLVKYSRLWSLYLRATTILRHLLSGCVNGPDFGISGSLVGKVIGLFKKSYIRNFGKTKFSTLHYLYLILPCLALPLLLPWRNQLKRLINVNLDKE